MLPYLLLFMSVTTCLALSYALGINFAFYFSCLLLIGFSGIRHGVGMDYENYETAFRDIANGSDNHVFEPLNVGLIKAIAFLGGGPHSIFFAYAAIALVGIFFFAKHASTSKELTVFSFMCIGMFYLSTFNQVRQWAAIGMMLIAVVHLADRRIITSVCFAAGAMLFHLSAVTLIILPALTRRYKFTVFLSLFLLSGVIGKIALIILQNSYYFRFLEALRSDRKSSLVLVFGYVALVTTVVGLSGYFRSERHLTRIQIISLNLCLVSLLILAVGHYAGIDFAFVMRVNMYFSVPMIALIPMLVGTVQRPLQHIAHLITVAALGALFFLTLYSKGNFYHLTPFRTWL